MALSRRVIAVYKKEPRDGGARNVFIRQQYNLIEQIDDYGVRTTRLEPVCGGRFMSTTESEMIYDDIRFDTFPADRNP